MYLKDTPTTYFSYFAYIYASISNYFILLYTPVEDSGCGPITNTFTLEDGSDFLKKPFIK